MSNRNQQWIDLIYTILSEESTRATMTIDDLVENGQLLAAIESFMASDAIQDGEAVAARMAALYHQIHDEETVEKLDELFAFFQIDKAGTEESQPVIEPQSAPRYNFNFLPKRTAATVVPTIPEELHTRLQQQYAWARDQLGTLWINVAQLLTDHGGLQPALATRGRSQQHADEDVLLHFTAGKEELTDLDVEVKAVRIADSQDCALTVTAWMPDQWPAVARFEVTILGTASDPSAVTDDEGKVTISPVPSADLDHVVIKLRLL